MQSSIIGKIEKAKRYAAERDRLQVRSLSATVRGDHGDHAVTLVDDRWSCACDFFSEWSICSHTMALERVLEGLVTPQALPAGSPG